MMFIATFAVISVIALFIVAILESIGKWGEVPNVVWVLALCCLVFLSGFIIGMKMGIAG